MGGISKLGVTKIDQTILSNIENMTILGDKEGTRYNFIVKHDNNKHELKNLTPLQAAEKIHEVVVLDRGYRPAKIASKAELAEEEHQALETYKRVSSLITKNYLKNKYPEGHAVSNAIARFFEGLASFFHIKTEESQLVKLNTEIQQIKHFTYSQEH